MTRWIASRPDVPADLNPSDLILPRTDEEREQINKGIDRWATDEGCGYSISERGRAMTGCSVVAVVSGTVYPCRSHKDGKHHFAAHWPACPAPFCRLEPGHRSLHDVPSGKAEIRHPEPAPAAAGTETPDADA